MPDEPSMSADELQARMARLRGELRTDVTRTRAAAKRLTDWRYYVRQFPWASAATMVAAGFMLVPKKRERPLVDESALEKMVGENRVVVIPQKAVAAQKSMIGSIGALVAAAAARAAMNYVSHRLAQMSRPVGEEPPVRIRTPK